MAIDWSTVIGNAIGNSISGVIVATVLIVWSRSVNRFIKTMTGKPEAKDEGDSK